MELNIVTGGDSKYFDLINELCISIEKLEDKNLMISVLDGGLSSDQVKYFRSERQTLVKLPKTRAIVFGIHTFVMKVENLEKD